MQRHQGDTAPSNQLGEVTGFKSGQSVYVHELIHLFGAGYHSNAFQCTTPDADMSDMLKCPSYEYGDLFDILGTSQSYVQWIKRCYPPALDQKLGGLLIAWHAAIVRTQQ